MHNLKKIKANYVPDIEYNDSRVNTFSQKFNIAN
jgi:hypothetical protein